jgi:hypothetical protein
MMGRSHLATSLVCAMACLACGSELPLSVRAAQIHEAAPEDMGKCVFLGTVVGSTRSYAWVSQTVENAQTDALNQAAGHGATHVVWVSVSGATAMARGYRCAVPNG